MNPIHTNQLVVGNILKMLTHRGHAYNGIYDTMVADYDSMYSHMSDNKEYMIIVGLNRATKDESIVFNMYGVEKFDAPRAITVNRIFQERRVKQKEGILDVIIITRVPVNVRRHTEMTSINYVPDIKMRVTFFTYGEMYFNILEHSLNSRYERLTPEESSSVLKCLRSKGTELNQIAESDLSVRYIGACPGDILRVIRPSETSGTAITYSRVTGAPYNPTKSSDKEKTEK